MTKTQQLQILSTYESIQMYDLVEGQFLGQTVGQFHQEIIDAGFTQLCQFNAFDNHLTINTFFEKDGVLINNPLHFENENSAGYFNLFARCNTANVSSHTDKNTGVSHSVIKSVKVLNFDASSIKDVLNKMERVQRSEKSILKDWLKPPKDFHSFPYRQKNELILLEERFPVIFNPTFADKNRKSLIDSLPQQKILIKTKSQQVMTIKEIAVAIESYGFKYVTQIHKSDNETSFETIMLFKRDGLLFMIEYKVGFDTLSTISNIWFTFNGLRLNDIDGRNRSRHYPYITSKDVSNWRTFDEFLEDSFIELYDFCFIFDTWLSPAPVLAHNALSSFIKFSGRDCLTPLLDEIPMFLHEKSRGAKTTELI